MNRALLLLLLAGCAPWELPTQDTTWGGLPLWDADAVALSDGLYVSLPRARSIARVTPDGQSVLVDLDGTVPSRMVASPDGERLLVFGSYPRCETDEPDVETVDDCDEVDGELSLVSELLVIDDGAVASRVEVAPHYNALTFTPDGQRAVATLDFALVDDLGASGLTNYNAVLFIDLATGEATPVPVGFAADRVLFTADSARAVVLSRSQVVLVDLDPDYEIAARFPLSLDIDNTVVPEDVALTPDGGYALISVRGSSELYVIDLLQESINLVELASQPSDMVVTGADIDRTVMVYASVPRVDVLEHTLFEVEGQALDEPANRVLLSGDKAMLYNDQNANVHDVVQLDLSTGELLEMRAENPVSSLMVAPGGAYAVAVTRPEGGFADTIEGYYDANWGVDIFELSRGRSVALVAASQPVGLAAAEDGATALVLLDGLADLLLLDLANGSSEPVELADAPLGIGSFGVGGFFITHDAALGMVSFLDPDSGELTPVGGFASAGLILDEIPLPSREDD